MIVSRRIEIEKTKPLFVPVLEFGDLIHTALVRQHRMYGGLKRRAAEQVFGRPRFKLTPRDLLGVDAEEAATRPFEAGQWRRVLDCHSLYGFQGKFFGSAYGQLWESALRDGNSYSALALERAARLQLFDPAKGLKWCCACVDEAVHRGKMPSWKVLHQLQFLSHCAFHRVRLLNKCPSCDNLFDRGNSLYLPGDPCSTCGYLVAESQCDEICDGMISLGTLCQKVFEGRTRAVEPFSWFLLMKAVRDKFRDIDAALHSLVAVLHKKWTAPRLNEFVTGQGSPNLEAVLARELQVLGPQSFVVPKLLLLDAIGGSFGEKWIDEQLEGLGEIDEASDEFATRFARRAADKGMPAGIVPLLLAGTSDQNIALATGLLPIRVSQFISDLPFEYSSNISRTYAQPVDSAVVSRSRSSRKFKDGKERIEHYKKLVTDALEKNPKCTRSELHSKYSTAVVWLYKNEPQWLDEKIPSANLIRRRISGRSYKNDSDRLVAYRACVEEALGDHPELTRTKAYKTCGSKVIIWLAKNDPEWLAQKLPYSIGKEGVRRFFSSREEKTEAYRSVLKSLLADNPRLSRTLLSIEHRSMYGWLLKNDAKWFTSALPSSRRRG